ncbi:hypothetical protein, partial [Burkholderia sp. AU4i]|uniref:hypothetical protein n=1 Tax=Burkholderia sp. AU4i TaxID=1335308 RepID=UPI001C54E28A
MQMVRGGAASNFNNRHNRRKVALCSLAFDGIASISACSTTSIHAEYSARIFAAECKNPRLS